MIFDPHSHYDDERYDEDREDILKILREKNVGAITNICASYESLEAVRALTEKYDFIYGAVGLHPEGIDELIKMGDAAKSRSEVLDEMRELLINNDKMVAVGEIGLDYHYEAPPKDIQKIWFDEQMSLAGELKKPVVIHSRDACEDTMDILRAHPDVTGVMHCYSYAKETAAELLKMGYVIGVGGVVTFKNSKKLKETVEYVPLDKIVLETDCPYLAPEPYRGSRNDSSLIKYVMEEVARLKGIDVTEVEKACWDNACRLYGIKQVNV